MFYVFAREYTPSLWYSKVLGLCRNHRPSRVTGLFQSLYNKGLCCTVPTEVAIGRRFIYVFVGYSLICSGYVLKLPPATVLFKLS